MDKQELMLQIRKKKLGLLIADARIASHRTQEECAKIMGANLEAYQAYEKGEAAPSLPQIESIACFLNVPMPHFWGKSSLSEEGFWEEDKVNQRQAEQNKFIGDLLRHSREESGLQAEELAEKTAMTTETLQEYETGLSPIPLPILEQFCTILELDINNFYETQGLIGDWHLEKNTLPALKELPESIRDFISKPVNRPYIELAIRLSEMQTEKLRAIAETLLEITF